MQPILAESAHRGRAIAFVAALAVVASLAALAARPHPPRHRHPHLRMERCLAGCHACIVR